jgi:hypothetical protein
MNQHGNRNSLSRAEAHGFARGAWGYSWSAALLMLGVSNTTCVIPGHSCTLVGCADAAIITLRTATGAWTAGTYTIELSVDGTPGTCTLSIPDPPSSTQGTCSSSGNAFDPLPLALIQESKCVTVTQGNTSSPSCTLIPGQFHQELVLSATPVQVGLIVSHDGRELARETVALQYQAYRPNGPYCEPTCHRASTELTIAP